MAGWYDENYKFRAPMTLYPASAATGDFEIQIPTTWDLFWTNIQSTGYDIRVCDSDGTTPLLYDRDGFVYATKTLQIEIDNFTSLTGKPHVVWLYWGYAAATDGITAFVPIAPLPGSVALENPRNSYVITCGPENAGATKPRNTLTKNSVETIYVYWDITDVLAKRQSASQGSLMFEGVIYVSSISVYLAAADQAAMHSAVTDAVVRCIEFGGRIFIRTDLKAGTSGVDYTLELTFVSILNKSSVAYDARTVNARALLKVQDVSEV